MKINTRVRLWNNYIWYVYGMYVCFMCMYFLENLSACVCILYVRVCMCLYQICFRFWCKKYRHIHTYKYTYSENLIWISMCMYVHVFRLHAYNTYNIQSNKQAKKISLYLVCMCMYMYVCVCIWCMRYVFACIVNSCVLVCLSFSLLSFLLMSF